MKLFPVRALAIAAQRNHRIDVMVICFKELRSHPMFTKQNTSHHDRAYGRQQH
jgi:hypothetical protein